MEDSDFDVSIMNFFYNIEFWYVNSCIISLYFIKIKQEEVLFADYKNIKRFSFVANDAVLFI